MSRLWLQKAFLRSVKTRSSRPRRLDTEKRRGEKRPLSLDPLRLYPRIQAADGEERRTAWVKQNDVARQGERVMPAFVFFRRRDIERELGLILAGNLIVDIPKDRKSPLPHEQQMIAEMVRELTDAARSRRLATLERMAAV